MSRASEIIDMFPKDTTEAVDVKKVIKDLIDTEASDDNEQQGKIAQLLKGLAFSDDPTSDEFMKRLTDMISKSNFGDLTEGDYKMDDEEVDQDDGEDED